MQIANWRIQCYAWCNSTLWSIWSNNQEKNNMNNSRGSDKLVISVARVNLDIEHFRMITQLSHTLMIVCVFFLW